MSDAGRGRMTAGEAYEGVERMFRALAGRYARLYGMDEGDCMGECGLAFMRAYSTYEWAQERTFPAWCYYLANQRLMERLRTIRTRREGGALPEEVPSRREFSPAGLAAELSADGAAAVLAASLPPADVVVDALTASVRGLDDMRIMRRCVREYLESSLGVARAAAAWLEVREALG